MANVFRCEAIYKLPLEEVPGSVVNAFRPTRAIQRITNPGAEEYSRYLWNKASGSNAYAIEPVRNVFALLDNEQMEDLMFLYLQTLGWYVVPSSRKADTMRFEYMVLRPDSGKRGFVQVKTGQEPFRPAEYADVEGQTFLFQSNEKYPGEVPSNVTCIRHSDLLTFFKSSRRWLPRILVTKFDQANDVS